jgi:hypothetical protein
MLGYEDAVRHVTTAVAIVDNPKFLDMLKLAVPEHLTGAEVQSALDRFYNTPENGPIGIPYALMVVSMRSSGADDAAIQKLITELRKPVP